MTLLIVLGILGIALWFMFRFDLVVLRSLGRGMAKDQGLKGNPEGTMITCTSCGEDIYTRESVAYCEQCRKYS